MKSVQVLAVVCITLLLAACSKEGTHVDSYFYASVNGPSWNGEFRIQARNMEEFPAQAVISPSGDPAIPDVLIMTYNDMVENLSVSIIIPAEKRLTELTDDHEVFGMGIVNGVNTSETIDLISKTLSMHVTKLNTRSGGFAGLNIPSEVFGNFEGVMIHERWDNGVRIEESHTVKGDFKFYQE
ncbi:MAG: hypothetical protein R3301_10020 [Saprospiraceae bacterium]|nr:hypothetical protein [Saprospiraceae bacterium]